MKRMDETKHINELKALLKREINKTKELQEKVNTNIAELNELNAESSLKPHNINFKPYTTFEGEYTYKEAVKVLNTKIKFIQAKNTELRTELKQIQASKRQLEANSKVNGLSKTTEKVSENIVNFYGGGDQELLKKLEERLSGDEDYDEALNEYQHLLDDIDLLEEWAEDHPGETMTPEQQEEYLKQFKNF